MVARVPTPDDRDDEEPGLFAEINITPLTDVILVLLIIFMVTSSVMVDAAREGRLDVTLPRAGSTPKPTSPEPPFVVGVMKDERIVVAGEVVDDSELPTLLANQKRSNPSTQVVIEADGEVAHRRVVEVIDLVRQAGFENVGIGTEEGEAESPQ